MVVHTVGVCVLFAILSSMVILPQDGLSVKKKVIKIQQRILAYQKSKQHMIPA